MTKFEEYGSRRASACTRMDRGVMVIPSAPEQLRNNDVHHGYRQDSDLFYLTGFEEPQSVLVLTAGPKPSATLFLRPRDAAREVWDGVRLGVDAAAQTLGVDQAFDIAELAQRLPELLLGQSRLYYHLGRYPEFDQRLLAALDAVRFKARRGGDFPVEIIDSDTVVHEMRRLKSEAELQAMRRAAEITALAHREAMAAARPGIHEYELEAILRGVFRRHGSARVAYEPIVGSGPNATVLHHVKNDRRCEEGELVLIDAGCEYDYYAADVTRTFPVSGRFNEPQRELYEVVLQAQLDAIEQVRPGITLDQIHEATVRSLAQGLVELGLIAGPLDAALEEKRYSRYYMHRTSHYLGMDVHDVGRYYRAGAARALEPGVVLTIEPGLYVSATDADAPERYRGIGIRIEDDVLVTEQGAEVLSAAVPKTIAEVEQACGAIREGAG